MKRTSFIAALALAAGISQGSAVAAEPTARTNLVDNGIVINGIALNGAYFNGWHLNGLHFNGLHFNGKPLNGFAPNGRCFNGFRVNEATPHAAAANPFHGLDQAPLGQ